MRLTGAVMLSDRRLEGEHRLRITSNISVVIPLALKMIHHLINLQ